MWPQKCRLKRLPACAWAAYSQSSAGNDNCFYYQAVKHRRLDLLAKAPTAEEIAFTTSQAESAAASRGAGD